MAVSATSSGAQAARGDSSNTCLRFTFGTWTPSLDWMRAGHPGIDTSRVERDAAGRGWAAPTGMASGDTVLVLFPPWWAAGVAISLGTKALANGDTVTGKATALVADARRPSPTSQVRAWRVPCG